MARSTPCGVLARIHSQGAKTSLQTPGIQPAINFVVSSLPEPAHVDARFNQVVQCLNDEHKTNVCQLLRQLGLMGTTVSLWHASLHAWLIDIDGNVNSWDCFGNCFQGAVYFCVSSDRQQWFHKRMVPRFMC